MADCKNFQNEKKSELNITEKNQSSVTEEKKFRRKKNKLRLSLKSNDIEQFENKNSFQSEDNTYNNSKEFEKKYFLRKSSNLVSGGDEVKKFEKNHSDNSQENWQLIFNKKSQKEEYKNRNKNNLFDYSKEPMSNKKKNINKNIINTKINEQYGIEIRDNSVQETNIETYENFQEHELNNTNKNAFQFMMESRHKIIGRNSLGKILNHEEELNLENKEKLFARKAKLESWADKKGRIKRKLEEEEKEMTISNKLRNRKKRLKKLLTFEDDSSDDGQVFSNRKRKRSKKIDSESDSESIEIEKEIKVKTFNCLDTTLENSEDGFSDVESKLSNLNSNISKKTGLLNLFSFKNNLKKDKVFGVDNFDILVDNDCNSKGKDLIKVKMLSTNKRKPKRTKQKAINFSNDKSYDDSGFNKTTEKEENKTEITLNENEVKTDYLNSNNLRRSVRNVHKKTYTENVEIDSNFEGKDNSLKEKKTRKANVKLAPVFVKAVPKPKIDPEILEARRHFLESGVPLCLKKNMEKQRNNLENLEYNIFPTVSHVRQKPKALPEGYNFWSLPEVKLNFRNDVGILPMISTNNFFKLNTPLFNLNKRFLQQPIIKIKDFKEILQQIKINNPDYPVYKIFKILSKKNGLTIFERKEEIKAKQENRESIKNNKRQKKINNRLTNEIAEANPVENLLWTEKYKPTTFEEILGNSLNILELKNWLLSWKEFSENLSTIKTKVKFSEDSSSDFDNNDSESYSLKFPNNAIIITGPPGSGKTMAIYTLCQELNINVLELNVSSKRTGKKLLQELQEATQSYQVRKQQNDLSMIFQKNSTIKTSLQKGNFKKNSGRNNQELDKTRLKNKNMCLLLVDDVDIVFDQDDGFINSLGQLLVTSKRPAILVATNKNCLHLQKFISQYQLINFHPVPSKTMAIWLQILCLVEGFFFDKNSLREILEWNKCDIRKTLLQLQFWIQSNQIVSDKINIINNELKDSLVIQNNLFPPNSTLKRLSCDESLIEDSSNDSVIKNSVETLKNTIPMSVKFPKLFLNFESNTLPFPLNLDSVWWNFYNIFDLKRKSSEIISLNEIDQTSEENILKNYLRYLSKTIENLSMIDVIYTKKQLNLAKGSIFKSWESNVKDSIELVESMQFPKDQNFTFEWTHFLTNGCYSLIRSLNSNANTFNIGFPSDSERRWRDKQFACENEFSQCVAFSSLMDRKSFGLDYYPILRNIARSEVLRAATSNKRHNRFYNYLRSLGITCNENLTRTACDTLMEI